MEENYTVYIHISPNNKYYVGITKISVKRRWNNGHGYIHNSYFYRAIKKHGWGNFQHEIIAEHLTKDEACNFEQVLIAKLNSRNPKNGYNILPGGETGTLGMKCSDETRKKISEKLKGNKLSADTRAKISKSNLGHKCSESTKRKISLANSHPKSQETKNKISKSKIGQGAKPIIQYDLDMNFIKEWNCAFDAYKELNFKSKSSIANVLSGRCKQTHGFIFKYKYEYDFKEEF